MCTCSHTIALEPTPIVREARTSRHNVGPIESSPYITRELDIDVMFEGFQGFAAFNQAPMMSKRYESLGQLYSERLISFPVW